MFNVCYVECPKRDGVCNRIAIFDVSRIVGRCISNSNDTDGKRCASTPTGFG